MSWMPAAVPFTRVCGRLLLTRDWLPCTRAASARPTPALDVGSDSSSDQPVDQKRAVAAHLKRMRYRLQPLPERLVEAIQLSIADFSLPDLQRDAKALNHRLAARHPPTVGPVMQGKAEALERQFIDGHQTVNEQKLKRYVIKHLKQDVYHWQPLEVDSEYRAAVYLLARFAAEYASLSYCFRQAVLRDAAFVPRSVLNYSSAAGAALWAARQLWGDAVAEFVGIERRQHLLELAARLAVGGRADAAPDPSVFLRPLLPSSSRLQYPLVVSSHALLELPSQSARLELVTSLWERTAPGGRLMLLETGNNAGYLLVLEARDLILSLARRGGAPAHVEAPCPHDVDCPRFSRSLTACHFQVPMWPLPVHGGGHSTAARVPLSFVTLHKAPRPADDRQRPRVVQPVLCRHNHVICRLCTKRGALEEVVVTKRRHGTDLYRCAKNTEWGHTMPIELRDNPPEDTADS